MEHKIYTESSDLPPGLKLGSGSRIVAQKLDLGTNVRLGSNTIVAGDRVALGDDVLIASNTSIRSSDVRISARSEIGSGCEVLVSGRFHLGKSARLSNGTKILCADFTAGELLYFGNEVVVGYGGTTESTAKVKIGDRVAVGPHSIINANTEITLEDGVGTGSYVTLWTHGYHFGHSILDGYHAAFDPIHIMKNVWLGYHVTVLPGVSVGENTIVAAGGVVAKALPPNVLAAGVPARAIRELEPKALPPEVQLEIVDSLLKSWARTLQEKGAHVVDLSQDRACFAITHNESTETVLLVNDEVADAPRGRNIFVSIDSRAQMRAKLDPMDALFEIRDARLTGMRTPLSEDLRDYMRRHTLPCGTDVPFSSIEPTAFMRLRAL